MERYELDALRDGAMTWADQVSADEAARYPEEARFPYLGAAFELTERVPGAGPALPNVHVFNWGATMSHGAIAGDIPGLAPGATRLAQGIARGLFVMDRERHLAAMRAFDDQELKPTRYFTPRGP